MEGKHSHKKSSRLNPCESETGPWLSGDGFKLWVSDKDAEIIGSHKVTSLCNQAFVSLELEDFLDHCFRRNNYWAVFNDTIVLRLESCSLVPRDVVVLDSNQRLSLGSIKSPHFVHLKPWNQPLSHIKCSQIWVSITTPLSYLSFSRQTKYPENIAKVEQIIHTKFLGHVLTKGQNLLLDTSRDDSKLSKMFDVTVTEIIGGMSAQGNLARGLLEKNTIIRAFPGDVTTEWRTHTLPINKWRYDFNLSCLEHELNKLEIGGLALPLKTVLEGVFGSGSLPLPHSLALSLAHRKVKGVLLYGPPRTGKTFLANNIHNILGTTKPKIIKYGMSPKALLSLFGEAIKDYMINRCYSFLGKRNGKRNQLHLFIIENVEHLNLEDQPSVFSAMKDRIATLTTLIDGLDNILIIGTTSQFHYVLPKVLRAGRFELHVKLDLPNNRGRSDILNMFIQRVLRTKRLNTDDLDFQEIALKTYGLSASGLEGLVYRAVHNAMKRVTPLADLYTSFGKVAKGTKLGMDDFYVALRGRSSKIICPLLTLNTPVD